MDINEKIKTGFFKGKWKACERCSKKSSILREILDLISN